jgi:hypothetical protein
MRFRLAKRFIDRELNGLQSAGHTSKASELATFSTQWLPTLVFGEHLIGRTGAQVERVQTDRYVDVRIVECTPVSFQNKGDCEANSWMDLFEMLMPPDRVVQLSRRFSYWTGRRTHGAECVDDGTYAVAIARAAQEIGVCREDLYPYSADVNLRPTDLAYAEAFSHRLGDVYAIRAYGRSGRDRLHTVRSCVDLGFPVQDGCLIGPEYHDAPNRDDVAFDPPTNIDGGHAQVITGYREFSDGTLWFLHRNSWGTGWARGGRAWVKDTYIADRLACDELSIGTLPPDFR